MTFRENITPEQEDTVAFLDSKSRLCREIDKALRPFFHKEAGMDLCITIRPGRGMAIKLTTLHVSADWKDVSGGFKSVS